MIDQPDHLPAPSGKEEVCKALVSVALQLWTERGMSISVREIARAAGVNHGLVHRYFGGREGLIRAALNKTRRDLENRLDARDQASGFTRFFSATDSHSAYVRLVFELLQAGDNPLQYQDTFPFFDWVEDNRRGEDHPDARMRAAIINAAGTAMIMNWDYFMQIAGLDGDRNELRARAVRLMANWLEVPE